MDRNLSSWLLGFLVFLSVSIGSFALAAFDYNLAFYALLVNGNMAGLFGPVN